MRIAIDVMGGDFYPHVPMEGAVLALKELPKDFVIQLVGQKDVIASELRKYDYDKDRIQIVNAEQVVGMDEKIESATKKKDSSVYLGIQLQKKGESDAFVSAGNTAAVMSVAFLALRRISGISRPAIAATFPTESLKPCVVLDVGANVDCSARQLQQFGIMGAIYARYILNINKPLVGLISIGEEDSKGNKVTLEAHKLLSKLHQNGTMDFKGNIEGRDVLSGAVDVVVTDGFTGNIVLKLTESLLPSLKSILKTILHKGAWNQRIFAMLTSKIFLGPTIGSLKRAFDVDNYGGAPLLGIDGNVIIAHGGASPRAIASAIDNARKAILNDITRVIKEKISSF